MLTFYAHLEHAVAKAKELGITGSDLNMGSGWNANSPKFVNITDGMGNMGLGRADAHGHPAEGRAPSRSRRSPRAVSTAPPCPSSTPRHLKLQGVLVAKRTGVVGTVTGNAALFDDGATTWSDRPSRSTLLTTSFMIDTRVDLGSTSAFDLPADIASKIADGPELDEVVALYCCCPPAARASTRPARTGLSWSTTWM